jgi:ribosomal protein S18 acetylase RimI-like enzyme
MESSKYVILQQNPTPQECHDLRKAAGLTPPPLEAILKALTGSWVSFVAFERGLMESDMNPTESQPVITMGRLIGDGALFLQAVDIAVHPAHQHKGLGNRLYRNLLSIQMSCAPRMSR